MSMREKMAWAMCLKAGYDRPDAERWANNPSRKKFWEDMLPQVDAALDALMELTEAVAAVGEEAFANRHYHSGGMREIAVDLFKDMIRAVKEGK